jgi:hypothetical protein
MSDASTILASFGNATINALSDEVKDLQITLARTQVDSDTYGGGTLYELQVARLAAHNMLVAANVSKAGSSGQSLIEKRVGPRMERYAGATGQALTGIQSTTFGQEYDKTRNECVVPSL